MARDLHAMRAALCDYLEGGDAITEIVPLSTGHSNETYLLLGLDRVLRTPPSEEGLLPPYDMARQHAVIGAVGSASAGPPVPRVFELCDDPSLIGDPFFLMERLPGEAFEHPDVPQWLLTGDASLRHRMCAQWIGAVASVHAMPPLPAFGPARTPGEEIAHWRAIALGVDAPSELLSLLDDLLDDPPRVSGPPTCVHGDTKLANCLWHEGRLRAFLDWEMAGVGEPLSDLGYMLSFFADGESPAITAGFDLPGWWDRRRVLERWEAATDRSAEGVRRHEVGAMAKIATILSVGCHLYATGRASDPRFGAWQPVVPLYVAFARFRLEGSL